MHLLVWGSNVTSPFPGDAILTCPTRIELEEGEEVIWVGWVNVILKRADGSIHVRGNIPHPDIPSTPVSRVVGSDNLEAILGTDGFVYPLAWPEEESDAALAPTAEESVKDKAGQQGAFNERSKVHWSDVIANERGVFALSTSSPAEICFFSDISHLCSFDRSGTDNASSSSSASPTAEEARAEENKNGVIRIQCPPSPNLQLFTTEHRAFLYCGAQPPSPHTSSSNAPIAGGGGMNILLEVDIKTSPPGFLPIQVDALSFTVVPGSANRLGILSDMGEAWVMGSRTRDLDLEVIPSDEEAREGEGEQGQDGTPADDSMGSSDDSGSQGESLSDGGETHLMGLGSDFTLLVRDDGVWVKGDNEMGQLACPPSELLRSETYRLLPIDASKIRNVHCSRWTAILTMDD